MIGQFFYITSFLRLLKDTQHFNVLKTDLIISVQKILMQHAQVFKSNIINFLVL